MKRLLGLVLIVLMFLPLTLQAKGQLLCEKDIKDKDLETIYLMRNEVFARHGRPFKNKELFVHFNALPWYKQDMDYTDARLSSVDKKNIQLLLKLETELLKKNIIKSKKGNKINWGNIINKRQFGKLSKEDIVKISKNGFIVVPALWEQFFFLYEDNTYKNIASFITTDSILQLYHMFFDFTLRNMESEKLYDVVEKLTQKMMSHSKFLYEKTNDKELKELIYKNYAYFGVANYFLTHDETIEESDMPKIVMDEVNKCQAHEGRGMSGIFDRSLDYSQFVPRGHYTRTDRLKAYFKAMMWYGLAGFEVKNDDEFVRSLIVAHQLVTIKEGDKYLIDLWQKIYEPTSFYVGLSDDLGPTDYKYIIDEVWGNVQNIEDFRDTKKLASAKKMAKKLALKTKIKFSESIWTKLQKIVIGPEFRFMGQRYVPDSYILNKLAHWPERPLPKGLDVMAVLGSGLAKSILIDKYKEGEKWKEYPEKLEKLILEFNNLSLKEWDQNLYFNWIWTMKSLINLNKDYKYPFFMNNQAWQEKNLNSALAAWAELRHDTILYADMGGAECGGDEECCPDPLKSYVEPNVEFYERMHRLLEKTYSGLKKRDLLSDRMELGFTDFIKMVLFLKDIAAKELKDEEVTNEEHLRMLAFGAELENMTITVMIDEGLPDWHEIRSEVDKNIAVIADVFTAGAKALEVAVGPAYEIYVVVPMDGKLKLTRGAVFSYYEFLQPVSNRLTDEEWQKMLKKEQNLPPLPDWINYLSNAKKANVPVPDYTFDSGC